MSTTMIKSNNHVADSYADDLPDDLYPELSMETPTADVTKLSISNELDQITEAFLDGQISETECDNQIDAAINATDDVPFDQPDEPVKKKRGRKAKDTSLVKVLTDEEKLAIKIAALKEEQLAKQALVPWTVPEPSPYGYRSNGESNNIVQWADDHGTYPTRYRSYSREEWTKAIDILAKAVNSLESSDPDYQRLTGLYVEEHTPELVLICAKAWRLKISVPTKASVNGKRFELTAAEGKEGWGQDVVRFNLFAQLLMDHVPAKTRAILLDICCQYLRPIRVQVNRMQWCLDNPEIAHLMLDVKN